MLEDANSLASFEAHDVEAVVQDEVKLAMSRYQRQASPRAILLAGQPGAGKTELSAMLSSEMAGDVAFINGDDYRRYHPHRRQAGDIPDQHVASVLPDGGTRNDPPGYSHQRP